VVEQSWDYQWSRAGVHCDRVDHDPLVLENLLLAEVTNWEGLLSVDSDFS